MRRFVAFVVALVAILLSARPSDACMNATLSDDPAYKRLHEADEALDEGDVRRARELASPVANGDLGSAFNPAEVKARGERIVALSWIRDRAATPEAIDRAIAVLRLQLVMMPSTDPRLQADVGEAFARGGRDDEAYEHLAPLAKQDLIGSPYAYAALARVAARRGDEATASSARKRCSEITSSAAICRGEYPSPPILRGKTLGYALPGALALLALFFRRRAKRPWSAYGDKVFATAIVATCAFVFTSARSPATATMVTAAVLFLAALLQRLFFLSAVKRDRVPGYVLRDASAEDGNVPAMKSFFHSGHRVLEHVPDASYREPARVTVLRLSPRRRGALVLAVLGLFMLALLGTCATLTMRTTKSERVSAG